MFPWFYKVPIKNLRQIGLGVRSWVMVGLQYQKTEITSYIYTSLETQLCLKFSL